MKKLIDPVQSTESFFANVNYLGEKLGPILFQLPPFLPFNYNRLELFLEHLPTSYRYTFEFRNTTWYNDKIYDLLKKYNVAFCIYEIDRHLSPITITADFVYVRLHGPEGKYAGSYTDKALKEWAKQCLQWSKNNKEVFIYFDNDQLGYAAFNAQRLLEMINSEILL